MVVKVVAGTGAASLAVPLLRGWMGLRFERGLRRAAD
jgi:hypothetical protein